jgi:phytoene/squalene synthetase
MRTRRLHINRLDNRRSTGIRRENLPALLFHFLSLILDGRDDVIQLFNFFHEVADVQEGVAIEANFHEGRLHAWQHARNFAFVDASN